MKSWKIKDRILEFYEDSHTYLVDGVIVPSVTTILKAKFGQKYEGVNNAVLKRAAFLGTQVHKAIEEYCTEGKESDFPELRNFKFLQRQYGFEVLGNEVPVIVDVDDFTFAGTLDLVLRMDGMIGGADIKRTSNFDKEYLGYQLNLYRIGYLQCYGIEWEFLRGIHLRGEERKFAAIPIREEFIIAWVRRMLDEGKISR